MRKSTTLPASLVVLLTAASSTAQLQPTRHQPAPNAILNKLAITSGLMQDLILPYGQVGGFDVRITLGDETHILMLNAHDIRAADFKLLVDDGGRLTEQPKPANTTFRGVVAGKRDSLVSASLHDGQLHAQIRIGAQLWAVQPAKPLLPTARRTTHVAYDTRHNRNLPTGCREFHAPGQRQTGAITGGSASFQNGQQNSVHLCRMACDADYSFYQKNGSDVIATQNDVVRVMNGVATIFRADLNVDYRITNVIVRRSPVYSVTGSTAILGEFKDYWNANHPFIKRDLAHLFTDRRMGNVIGVAWVGVVCSRSLHYGVSVSRYNLNIARRINLTAHEAGHNWGAPHCSNPPTNCNIMCGNTGPCFSAASKAIMRRHRDSRSCLVQVPRGPNLIAMRGPVRGERMAWSYRGAPNDFYFLSIGVQNTSTRLLGYEFMDNSFLLKLGQLDREGIARNSFPVPTTTSLGLQFYSQLVTADGTTRTINGTSWILRSTVR